MFRALALRQNNCKGICILILDLIGISSPRSVVGIESLRHLLDQSDASKRLVTGRLNQFEFPKGS